MSTVTVYEFSSSQPDAGVLDLVSRLAEAGVDFRIEGHVLGSMIDPDGLVHGDFPETDPFSVPVVGAGPAAAVEALKTVQDVVRVAFVRDVDGAEIAYEIHPVKNRLFVSIEAGFKRPEGWVSDAWHISRIVDLFRSAGIRLEHVGTSIL